MQIKEHYYQILTTLWMTLIFITSHQSSIKTPPTIFEHTDKIAHATVYAILGFLLYRSLRWNIQKKFILAVALGTAYGLTDEIHQYFVPGRSADVFDLLADFTGSVIGALVASHLKRPVR